MKKLLLAVAALFTWSAFAAPIARDLGAIITDFGAPLGPQAAASGGLFETGSQFVSPIDLDAVDDDSDLLLVFELAGNAAVNEFGFSLHRPDLSVAKKLKIFDGTATGLPGFPTTETVSWAIGTGVATSSFGAEDFSEVIKDALAGWTIGLFLDTPGGTFYSHDSLNPGGVRQVGIFDVSGIGPILGDLAIAWEDLPNGGDGDYNDMLILATDLSPGVQQVPAPAGLVAFVFGAGAMLWNRRKSKQS